MLPQGSVSFQETRQRQVPSKTTNDERSYPKGVIAMMMELMNVEPLFWIGMGAVAAVICLMQAVCWTRTPKMRRNE